MKKQLIFILVSGFFQGAGLAQEVSGEWTVDDIFGSSRFALKGLSSVQWLDGGRKFSYVAADTATGIRNLYLYTLADGKSELVVDGALLAPRADERPVQIASYQWSPDGKTILVTDSLPARKLKSGGNFGIYDVAAKTFRMLTNTHEHQEIIKFSPDGSKIGFVRSHNLFVLDLTSGRETQLTFDGSEDIINGGFDWVYEEEFAIIDGWMWSPDSRQIAFWRLDQSAVSKFPLVRYSKGDAHATVDVMHYPKAGDHNSLVSVGVVNIGTRQIVWLNLGENPDIYIPRIQWTKNPEFIAVQRMNRGQDTLDLILANVLDGTVKTILTETDTAWVEIEDNLTFLEKSDQFLWTSFRDGNTHIYLYERDGTLVRQVTRGPWDVTQLVGVNEKRKLTYFIATQASPRERHLYSVRFDGTGMRRLTREPGWHSVNIAPDYLTYIDTHSSAKTPTDISLRANDGTLIARLIENSIGIFGDSPMGDLSFFSFKTVDSVSLNGWMITPPGSDRSKKYPVLMYVYGGPGSQTVVDRWGGTRYLWHQMMAQHGYIIVSVDNRSSGGRGKSAMQGCHRRLGVRETEDHIESAKYLASLPYVDASRIGIWGWSGGGYMTCMALTLGAEYFKMGIAVAPVTDFRFYDTIWTERYMDTPQHNPEGYTETSPITYAARYKGNLMIIHGTADDNVHWQNTIVFVNELIRQNKPVQTMFYPGRTHSIRGDNATRHLYSVMTGYILEKL